MGKKKVVDALSERASLVRDFYFGGTIDNEPAVITADGELRLIEFAIDTILRYPSATGTKAYKNLAHSVRDRNLPV